MRLLQNPNRANKVATNSLRKNRLDGKRRVTHENFSPSFAHRARSGVAFSPHALITQAFIDLPYLWA